MKAKYIPMSIAQITKETNTVAMHRILAILACEMAGLTFPVAMDALAYNYEDKKQTYVIILKVVLIGVYIVIHVANHGFFNLNK